MTSGSPPNRPPSHSPMSLPEEVRHPREKSTRRLLGTLTSGEGLLQKFWGTGWVRLAPTQEIYQRF